MAGAESGRFGGGAGSARKPLAPIATLLDLYRVGGLFNPRDLRTLAEAVDDPAIVRALSISEREVVDIRRRAANAIP